MLSGRQLPFCGWWQRQMTPVCRQHDARREVITADGEAVCTACGAVKGRVEVAMLHTMGDGSFGGHVGANVGSVMYDDRYDGGERPPGTAAPASAAADGGAAAALGGGNSNMSGSGGAVCSGDGGSYDSGGRASLYMKMEIGGKPNRRTFPADRFVRRNDDLSAVSNIAQKLGVPNHAARDVYAWYVKLRRGWGGKRLKMTKAKLLVLVFFAVCRRRGIPLVEDGLLEAIKSELHVKYAPPYLACVAEATSYLDEETGGMIIEKTGFMGVMYGCPPAIGRGQQVRLRRGQRPHAGAGDNGAGGGNAGGGNAGSAATEAAAGRFSIGGHTKSLLEAGYPPEVVEMVTNVARQLLPVLLARESGNPARAARVAMQSARKRCGV